MSLLRISRDHDGDLTVNGRAWQEDGTLSARYWSEAAKERRDPAGIFYFWEGRAPSAPECAAARGHRRDSVETADRATGYWTTRSDRDPGLNAEPPASTFEPTPQTSRRLDEEEARRRAELIAQRLREWKSAANAF